MISRIIAALLATAAVVAVSTPAAAEDFNLARHLLEHGDIAPEDVDYWTMSARQYDDWVAWKKIVERETAKAETQRREAAWRQAELARLEKEMNDFKAKQAAIDPKATMSSGPLEDYLKEVERVQAALDAGIDPKATMSSGPLEEYLEQYEREKAAGLDPKATMSSGPLQEYLEKYERMKAALQARAQGVSGELQGVQAVERWVRIVIDHTGQVIENDPVDVAHARLEDLIRRQAQVEASLKGHTGGAEFRAALKELKAIDEQLDDVLAQIGGEVWRRRSTHRDTCFPAPVPNQMNPVFNCHYWAAGLPRTLDSNAQLVLERVKLDIDEDEDGLPASLIAFYYARYPGQLPTGEAWSGASGEIRHGPGGVLSLVVTHTDEDGELRETSYPLTLSTGSATASLPIDGYGVLTFTFRRDPADYIPWADYEAAALGKAPDRRTNVDLTDVSKGPAPSPPPSQPYTRPEDLGPLTTNSPAPPLPPSAPYTRPEDLGPLTSTSPPPPASEPPAEDDFVAPLTPP